MNTTIPRRTFVKQAGMGVALAAASTATFSAKSYAAARGSNGTIQIAVLGTYRRYDGVIDSFANLPGVRVTWLCDVNAKVLEAGLQKSKAKLGYAPKTSQDLREVIAADDVDAVFILLPDHWHAAATKMALEHGKHVYVEKPCSHNLREDELLIEWSQKYEPLIQIGTQQRSSPETIEAMQRIHAGEIGEVYEATAFYSNNRDQLKQPEVMPAPAHLNWELFQGPAPRREFLDVVEDYNWHWFWHWGTAETGNNATHELDVARWALQVRYPSSVSALALKRHWPDDGWEMYDTMDVQFLFEEQRRIRWDGRSRQRYLTYGSDRGTIIYGTEGSVFVNRDGFRLFDRSSKLKLERMGAGNEAGTALGGGGDMTTLHVKNFFDAMQGKAKLNGPIDEGAYSTHLCHYANVSARLDGKLLKVNPSDGHFYNNQVMQEYWSRSYEPGWELE
ncbi:MAG: Gfo/Idh/MocA family oxidoreductase [Puniceicoccaceae bacterium]